MYKKGKAGCCVSMADMPRVPLRGYPARCVHTLAGPTCSKHPWMTPPSVHRLGIPPNSILSSITVFLYYLSHFPFIGTGSVPTQQVYEDKHMNEQHSRALQRNPTEKQSKNERSTSVPERTTTPQTAACWDVSLAPLFHSSRCREIIETWELSLKEMFVLQ